MIPSKSTAIWQAELTLRLILDEEVHNPELAKAYVDVINHLHNTVFPKFKTNK